MFGQVENVNRQLEVSERTLHERILKLEAQRIRLEEVGRLSVNLTKTKPADGRLNELNPKAASEYLDVFLSGCCSVDHSNQV